MPLVCQVWPCVSGVATCVRQVLSCARLTGSPSPDPRFPGLGHVSFLPRGTGVLSQGPRAPLTPMEALCASALSQLRVLPVLSPPGSLLCLDPLLGVLNTCSHGGLLETKPRGPRNQGGGASGQVAVRDGGGQWQGQRQWGAQVCLSLAQGSCRGALGFCREGLLSLEL